MACTSPKKAWEYGVTKNKKTRLVFKKPDDIDREPILLPCGKCLDCRLSYSREWATRIVHEAQTSGLSSFLTLTYDEDHIPDDRSVSKREIQLFIKRLRKKLGSLKIKYFACGEYGETRGQRPHYHLIILGFDFPDREYWSRTGTGNINYRSKLLESCWDKGFSTVGEVTFQSAGYVARYSMKKQADKSAYELVNTETGEVEKCAEEFVTMSQGIGKDWWNKYYMDTHKDYLNINGHKNKVPRYYDKQMEKKNPEKLAKIKEKRMSTAAELQNKETDGLRRQRNIVRQAQSKMLIRGIEKNVNN